MTMTAIVTVGVGISCVILSTLLISAQTAVYRRLFSDCMYLQLVADAVQRWVNVLQLEAEKAAKVDKTLADMRAAQESDDKE
jgi:hypothetical protein